MKQIRLYQIITAISCLFLISCGIEQNLKKADKHLSLGEYFDAATQYKKVYTKTPTKERAARGKMALTFLFVISVCKITKIIPNSYNLIYRKM